VNQAPDYVEPFEAWCVWKIARRDRQYALGSIIHSTVWPAGEPLVAECLARRLRLPFRHRHRHEAPGTGCHCGIYGATVE
jgi:hypothetical protein